MTNLATNVDNEHLKVPAGTARSEHWPAAREEHLRVNPSCIVCGGTERLEVHHIEPFHLHPERELDPDNFATLCEANRNGIDCHLGFGHLGNFKSWNADVLKDAAYWSLKIKTRPMGEVATAA